jgi:hypothetical protein
MTFSITQESFGEGNKEVKPAVMASIGISSSGERLQAHNFEVYVTCSVPNLERVRAKRRDADVLYSYRPLIRYSVMCVSSIRNGKAHM